MSTLMSLCIMFAVSFVTIQRARLDRLPQEVCGEIGIPRRVVVAAAEAISLSGMIICRPLEHTPKKNNAHGKPRDHDNLC